jgi:hypothetical protein
MMTGGFEESASGIARFEDVDPDVFAGFCHFAKNGGRADLHVPGIGIHKHNYDDGLACSWFCRLCGYLVQNRQARLYAFCSKACKEAAARKEFGWSGYCTKCGMKSLPSFCGDPKLELFCQRCLNKQKNGQ